MRYWELVLVLCDFLWIVTAGKCRIPDAAAVKQDLVSNKEESFLLIEGSKYIGKNITANIFAIFLEEELGYDYVSVIEPNERDIFNTTAAVERIANHDNLFNLELWVEPNFDIPYNQKERVLEIGPISLAGRFGWFVTSYKNISWKSFQDLESSRSFALSEIEWIEVQKSTTSPHTGFPYCPNPSCTNSTYTPKRCQNIAGCAVLLIGDYEESYKVIALIDDLNLYVKAVWLGQSLNRVISRLPSSTVKLALTLSPSDVTATGKWYPVAFPLCDLENYESTTCHYETRRPIKLVSEQVKHNSYAQFALEAAVNIELSRDVYMDIIRLGVDNPTTSHYDLACQWIHRNNKTWGLWGAHPTFNNKPVLSICGIFPINAKLFNPSGLTTAAVMAVEAVNRNPNILSNYQLQLSIHDGNCSVDTVTNVFINYVMGFDVKTLVGILGPACSETVTSLVGVTKYFRTMVISYAAEGSTLKDRDKYKYFFRTIGENQLYMHAYLEMMESLGWRRIAAIFSENFEIYTDYLHSLKDQMYARNLSLIMLSKISKDREIRSYLEELKSKQSRIIVADVFDHSAREIMCEVYHLKMTAAHGYVWFLPRWLTQGWWNSTYYNLKPRSPHDAKVNCSGKEMLEAIDGYFSLAHQFFAPGNQVTHENITVEQWSKSYNHKLGKDYPSDYAGFTYDAVWTYALAVDKLSHLNKSFMLNLRTPQASEKLASLINETDFMGVSGRIKFHGASRTTSVKVLQWINGSFHAIGELDSQNYKLTLNKSEIKWLTVGGIQPNDGEEPSKCSFQGLADFFNVECSGAIIIVNVIGFGLLAIILVIAIVVTKYRYDKKVEKFQLTEQYMKSMGFDLLAPNLSDLDKWEILRDHVVINRKLGEGAFGTVYGGEAFFEGQGWVAAAVKTLKINSTTEQKLDFLSEAEVMKRFDHKNVVKLLGVCTRDEPVYTVMEFMLYGDLKTYLLNRRDLVNSRRLGADETNEVSNKKLTAMALDIARGLSYLASLKYVHRDIACRNCLLNSGRVAKIADFGLTRPMFESDYYKFSRKGMLPIRWMAPESLADGLFTPSSDVWSYGVVLYEIATFGSYPFQGLSNNQVVEHVKAGNTIEIPKGIKPQLESLIKSCWNLDYKKRPTASEIVEFLANNPRLLAPCLDVPASAVAVDDSEGLGMNMRPSVPASPLEPSSFFTDLPSAHPLETTVELESSPPASPRLMAESSFFPDSARQLLLPRHRPVQRAMTMTSLAPLASPTPSDNDEKQSGSFL